MTTDNPEPQAAPPESAPDAFRGNLPQAEAVHRRGISIVWLIPVVALLVGGWLVHKTLAEQGPTIEIHFKSASGLQAGKTRVKFLDVEIGQVTAIDVAPDLKNVVVTAELTRGTEDYLTENTRFWVARPRVTASRVTGLETLLSGAFIAIDPDTSGSETRHFVGMEEPPLFTTSEPGTQYVLRSPTLGSLNTGSPIYYRQIQVGQVVDSKLSDDGEVVDIEIFVSAPHDRLIHTETRFWNASGVDFKLTADGIEVDTRSLLSVVIGGIEFANPDTLEEVGDPAPNGFVFPLYAGREKALEKIYLDKKRFLLFFSGSVRGLSVGAPVMLRGIRIGHVLDIQLKFDPEDSRFLIPVLIEVEPERIGVLGGDQPLNGEYNLLPTFVEQGLRGQLKSGSLITGQLYVDLDFHPEAPPAELSQHGDYEVIPTLAAPLDALTTKANTALDQINAFLAEVRKIPLAEIGQNLNDTLAGASRIANSEELKRSVVELEKALVQTTETMHGIENEIEPALLEAIDQTTATLIYYENLVDEKSPLYREALGLMHELSETARSLRIMADYLERHPEALIKGKGASR